MTEERFEAAMEHMGRVIERKVEGAANRAWRHRPVRFVAKTVSLLAGAGLLVSAVPLLEKGNRTGAKVCLISGGLVILAAIGEILLIKRK